MLKKSKVIIGATFIAQAFSCLVLALIYMKSNKNFAKTCLALCFVGGAAGGALLFDEYRKQLKLRREYLEDYDYPEDDFEDFLEDEPVEDIDCSIQEPDAEEAE